MLLRLSIVAWWLGALWGAGWIVSGAVSALGRDVENKPELLALMVAFGLALTVPLWALSFVLSGSFWSPPKSTRNRES